MTEYAFQESVRNLRNHVGQLEREGDYWSDEDRDRLRAMFGQGVGITEIAIRLQRTEPAVFQQIEKLDLYERKDRPKARPLRSYSQRMPLLKLQGRSQGLSIQTGRAGGGGTERCWSSMTMY